MSQTLYLVFNLRFPANDFKVTAEMLFGQIDVLDQVALQHDLVPLTSFADTTPVSGEKLLVS